MADPAYPDISAPLDGWRLVEEAVETVFELPAARVRGATRRYEDERTRTAVQEATEENIDHEWRFVAATRLGFQPSLPPGSTSVVLPTVRSEARRTFASRLAERGLVDVEQRQSESIRIRTGARAQLTRFEATDTVSEQSIPVTGWVGVWQHRGDFFVVTGGYPDEVLASALDIHSETDTLQQSPADYRDEFFEIVRSVR